MQRTAETGLIASLSRSTGVPEDQVATVLRQLGLDKALGEVRQATGGAAPDPGRSTGAGRRRANAPGRSAWPIFRPKRRGPGRGLAVLTLADPPANRGAIDRPTPAGDTTPGPGTHAAAEREYPRRVGP